MKKKYFDPAFFWSINISELIADAGLIVFAIFFSRYCFRDVDILHTLKPWQLMALYAVVVLTMPWYLGYMYAIFDEYYNKYVMRAILCIFIVIVLVVLIYMMRIMFSLNWLSDEGVSPKNNITDITGIFSLFLLVLGPMMSIGGVVAGQDDARNERKTEPAEASPTMALLIVAMAIAFLVWWASYPAVQNNVFLFILVFLGACVAAVAVWGIFYAFTYLLRKIGIYSFLSRIASLLFPFFIISILVLWSDIDQHFILRDFGFNGHMSLKGAIFTLTVAGFIPFRLIMLFQPPLRFINFAIGIAAFLFYMYSIKR